jgi:heptosyltransferase I
VRHNATHRFLIVRLGSLGDIVHGIPVAAALRERFPFARIDWMVDPRHAELLRHVKGIDALVPVRTWRPLATLNTVRMLRSISYTAVLDLQGLVKSAVLARAVGAWRTIGFPRAHLREPMARLFYSETPEPGERQHVVHKNLSLLAPLGARGVRPSFPIDAAATPVAQEVIDRLGGPYAVINPGAGWPNKRWPPERFAAVAATVRDRLGVRSLVVWGPGEAPLAKAVVAASEGAAEQAQVTSVSDLLGIARGARVMIAGDTGPLHLAAAVGTPVVALFGPTMAWRNGPWSLSDVTLSRTDGCACLYARRCRKKAPCIQDITVDEVVTAVARRLAR